MKRFHEFQLDSVNECLWRGSARLSLTPKAFKILNCLVVNVGRTVTKDEFMEQVWPGIYVGEENLKVYVRELRGLLGDDAGRPKFIETYRDKGYRFIAQVTEEGSGSDPEGVRLFGRHVELAKLNERFKQACSGNRQIVFVTGEPGIGKTSLVEAFLQQVSGHLPMRVGFGQCIESYREQEAFYPLLEAFGRLLHDSAGHDFAELLARHAPTWLVQFSGVVSSTNPEVLRSQIVGAGRERMLREICKALEILTTETPLVLVIEDLHWTDHSTLDFIAAVSRRREQARLLLLATYRPVEVILSAHPLRELKSELCLHGHASEIPLELLTKDSVANYLTTNFSADIANQIVDDVHQKTDGNPLFIEALMSHLIDQEMIGSQNGEWKLECDVVQLRRVVPDSLIEIIQKQVEQLSPKEQELLTAASVIGHSFSTAVLAMSLNGNWADIDEACDALSRRHLLLTRGGLLDLPDGKISGLFQFTHALHRDVIYSSCRPVARCLLHHRVGEAIEKIWHEQEHETAAELARHFQESRDYVRVVHYLQVQAANAEHRYAYQEAITLLELALRFTGELKDGSQIERVCEVKTHLARIYDKLGDKARSAASYKEVAEDAMAVNLNEIAAASLIGLSRELSFKNAAEALQIAERALTIFPSEISPMRLAAEAWTTFLRIGWSGWSAELQDEFKEKFDALRRLGESRILAEHAFGLAVVQMFTGDHDGALQTAEESIPLVSQSGDNLAHLTVHWMRNWALMRKGRLGESLQGLREALSLTRRNMSAFDTAMGQLFLAELHCEAFDPAGALSLCEEALPVIRQSQSGFSLQRALTISGIAQMESGELDYAKELLLEMHELHENVHIPFAWHWKLPLYVALTELSLLVGDLAWAQTNVERLKKLAEFHANLRYRVRFKQVSARLALAQGELETAKQEIKEALKLLEDRKFPLMAWRVHDTAVDVNKQTGDAYLVKHHSQIRDDILLELADSLSENEPLHSTIVRRVRVGNP
jgi:DNA-binding winged helix-turn-helix (wHTH) protein/tetratricopeptide (TPR) repeat protein